MAFTLLFLFYFSYYGRITSGPWITNPLVPPDTTPEQTIAGVAPDGVVTVSVLPVISVNRPVLPVTVVN
jgi:hypothetical protein